MKTRKQQCGKTYTGWDEYSQKMVQLKLSTNAKKLKTDWDEYSQKMVQLKLSTNAKKLKTSWDEYSQKVLQLKLSTNAKNRKPIGTNTHKKCYNSNCQKMRKTVNRLGRILAKNGTTQIANKCEKT